jgi:hypothetical protein
MKTISCLFCLLLLCTCSTKKSYAPADHLSLKEQDEFVAQVIRYISDLPKGVNNEQKFSKEHDAHYLEQQSLHRLDAYYPASDGTIYFMVSRRAPSITDKRVAIAGKLKWNKPGENMAEFEEVFRTWKMKPEVLQQRATYLFELMVKGEDLTRYQINNTSEEWIEFPDGRVFYDRQSRQWQVK